MNIEFSSAIFWYSISTSSEAESPLSSTTVSLKTSFESAADSGTSKEAVCLSACFSSTSGPSVCSHL